jgi:hypothetical protein
MKNQGGRNMKTNQLQTEVKQLQTERRNMKTNQL